VPKPPRVYKTPAIVLRQRKLGDADKIVTLYSANFGKIDAVAKGVRRITSRLAGHVEPLSHGNFMFAHGRNLDIVTQVQTIETFQALRDDLDRLSRALYVAELVDRATEERAENFDLYRLLLSALSRLAETSDLDLAVRFFEMSLLAELGYRPQLDNCAGCHRALPSGDTTWAPSVGGVVCPDCRPVDAPVRSLSPNVLPILRLLQKNAFQEVARLQLAPELADEIERVLRDALHFALERDVRSAAFLDTIRGRGRRTTRSAGPR
jgi:DNA repair protein RecO (recombination protein O)